MHHAPKAESANAPPADGRRAWVELVIWGLGSMVAAFYAYVL